MQSSRMKRKRSTQPSVNDDPFSGENDITVSSRKEQGKYGASKCTYVAANDTEVCSDILYPSITECMNELNGIEGVEDNHYIKACEKFRDPEWRIMFISMSAMRRRRWVENPVSYEVRSCVDVLNGIEGVEDKRIFKAIEKLPDPEWRKMFITMSAMSRRQWLESLT